MAKEILRLLNDGKLHTIKYGLPSAPDETYHDVRFEDVQMVDDSTMAVKRTWDHSGQRCTIFINLKMVTFFTVVE